MKLPKITSFTFHDAVGVHRDASLAKIGKLKNRDLLTCKKEFDKSKVGPVGWPSRFSPRDSRYAKKYNFKLEKFLVYNEFIKFGYYDCEQAKSIFLDYYPIIKNFIENIDQFSCESYFAHLHNDQHLGYRNRAQIMFILENKAQNRLFSIGKFKKEIVEIPEEGDIYILDYYRNHALFPNSTIDAGYTKANPLKFIGFQLSEK